MKIMRKTAAFTAAMLTAGAAFAGSSKVADAGQAETNFIVAASGPAGAAYRSVAFPILVWGDAKTETLIVTPTGYAVNARVAACAASVTLSADSVTYPAKGKPSGELVKDLGAIPTADLETVWSPLDTDEVGAHTTVTMMDAKGGRKLIQIDFSSESKLAPAAAIKCLERELARVPFRRLAVP